MTSIKNIVKEKIDQMSKFFSTDVMYIAKSGFWMNANFVFVSAFGLISSVLFAHLVSKEIYGTYQFALALAGIIGVFAPNTMSIAVSRAVAQGNEGDFKEATKYQLRWGVIASLIALCVSFWYFFNGNIGLFISLLAIAIFFPSTLALNTWNAYIQGKKDYKRYFIYNALSTTISYGGILLVLFLNKTFIWLVLANIVFAFIANMILFFITLKRMRPNTKTNAETIPYGKHLSIMGIPAGLVGQLDAILIFHYIGAPALAIYSFATLLPEKIAGGLKFIPIITLPKFSEKNEADVKSFFVKKIWWLLLFLSIVAIVYAIGAPYLFKILFPTYLSSVPYTQVYALSFFSVAASVAQSALLSQKKTRELYMSTLTYPVVKTLLMFILMFFYGIWGIIWAQLLTIIFQIIFPIILLNRSRSGVL